MTEVIAPVKDIEAARELFDNRGHVAISGLFAATQASQALAEHHRLFGKTFSGHAGATANARSPAAIAEADLAIGDIYRSIISGAENLGHDLRGTEGYKPRIQVVTLVKGNQGRRHTDADVLGDLTAVTNLEGRSRLEFWDPDDPSDMQAEGAYLIEPGVVAFMKGKEVPHRGVNESDGLRTGLVVSTEQIPR